MLRVLHIVTYMGRGGLETMLMNYYRHIDRMKVQFDFLVHRDFLADYDAEILALGGRIYRLPKLNPFSQKYLGQLNTFFAEHGEYKVVHSHLDCMSGIPLKYAKIHGVSVRIAHAHNSSQTKDKKYLLKLLFKKNIRTYATDLYACGQEAGEWMFSGKKFEILNNAIDTKIYSFDQTVREQEREKFKISKDTLLVGHVGRFRPQKNHIYLIELFKKLVETDKKAKLLLVGDGELLEEVKEKTRVLNMEQSVLFAGVRDDVSKLLQAIDVFCLPSLYEGLPVSIIEAQAAGLPCLISDKVPIACKITDLVKQLPLDANHELWIRAIQDAAKVRRRDTYREICESGFDIEENAKELQNFYIKVSGDSNVR